MVLTIESGKASLAGAFPLRLELSFRRETFVVRHYVHALRRDGQTWIMWNAPGGAKGGIVPVIAAVADPALCAHGKIEDYHAQEQILGKLGVARKTRSEQMADVFYGDKKRMKVNAVTEMLAIWTMNSSAATCAIEPLRTAVRQLHFDAALGRPLVPPTAAASPQTGGATAELVSQSEARRRRTDWTGPRPPAQPPPRGAGAAAQSPRVRVRLRNFSQQNHRFIRDTNDYWPWAWEHTCQSFDSLASVTLEKRYGGGDDTLAMVSHQ